MNTHALSVGYYAPTPAFQSILEHVCVMREDQRGGGTPVAICGPAGDAQSEADARVFAAAYDLLEAAEAMDALMENLWKAVEWGKTFDLDVSALNTAPPLLKRAIANARGTQRVLTVQEVGRSIALRPFMEQD